MRTPDTLKKLINKANTIFIYFEKKNGQGILCIFVSFV